MGIARQTFFNYIKAFKLKELFNELGWDKCPYSGSATCRH